MEIPVRSCYIAPVRVRTLGIVACALACGAVPLLSFQQAGQAFVRTSDRNHDGRPDAWRYYDANGQLVELVLDNNFDGTPDEIDRYHDGRLQRRELDRNHDQRTDVVEQFDGQGQPVRTIVDVDFDGRADLLVLFRDGRPVLTRWEHAPSESTPSAARFDTSSSSADTLQPLRDPFQHEGAWNVVFTVAHASLVAVSQSFASSAVPVPRANAAAVMLARLQRPRGPTSRGIRPRAVRGPPAPLHA